ncbi:MAG: Hpt domain-containing protein [Herbinix sp.]|nr:Hpt domain-containing protein [Herbinix sp.]
MSEQFSNEILSDMYIFEMSQLIEQLEEVILSNEKTIGYSDDTMNEIFRIMHTIKELSTIIMFENISTLAHAMEDLFYYIRNDRPQNVNYSELSDITLACIDFIKIEMLKIRNGNTTDGEYSALVNNIENFLSVLKQQHARSANADTLDNNKIDQFDFFINESSISKTMDIYKAVIFFEENCQMENIRAYSIVHNLKKSLNELYYIPSDIIDNDESVEIIRKEGFKIYFKTDYSYDILHDLFMQIVYLKELQLTKMNNEDELNLYLYDKNIPLFQKDVTNQPYKQEKDDNDFVTKEIQMVTTQQSIISVNVTLVDKLMDLVGEMVIAETKVIQNLDLNGLVLDNFQKAARQLLKITDEIQDMIIAIRMQ